VRFGGHARCALFGTAQRLSLSNCPKAPLCAQTTISKIVRPSAMAGGTSVGRIVLQLRANLLSRSPSLGCGHPQPGAEAVGLTVGVAHDEAVWRYFGGPRRREAAVVSRRDTRRASHTLPTGDARAQIDRVHNHSSRATTGPTPCRPGAVPQQRYEYKVKSRNNKAT
jgi:hypothetical protein